MIEVHDVRKQFGDVKALGGVSFSARDGQITALLGPNGAGKTTLLRTLVGLLKRDQGTIAIDGVDPEQDPLAVRRNIGFLTDQFGLYELLSMDDILERRTKGFSQGQRIKVALARTLLHRPRNLLLDEPSRGLDVMSTRALRRALSSLRADGCCVIMATHVMQEVTHLCDDVIVIAQGHTVAQGSPVELCRRTGIENLEDAFVSLVGEEGIAA
jgi:sodium transport system ATP-binding protein